MIELNWSVIRKLSSLQEIPEISQILRLDILRLVSVAVEVVIFCNIRNLSYPLEIHNYQLSAI